MGIVVKADFKLFLFYNTRRLLQNLQWPSLDDRARGYLGVGSGAAGEAVTIIHEVKKFRHICNQAGTVTHWIGKLLLSFFDLHLILSIRVKVIF